MMLVPNQLWRSAAMALVVLSIASEAAAQDLYRCELQIRGPRPVPRRRSIDAERGGDDLGTLRRADSMAASQRAVQCPLVSARSTCSSSISRQRPRRSSPAVLGRTHIVPARIDCVGIYVDYDETQSLIESVGQSQLITAGGPS
jgi:hypothetical protein